MMHKMIGWGGKKVEFDESNARITYQQRLNKDKTAAGNGQTVYDLAQKKPKVPSPAC